jgi:modulator of FtsH protease HflK
MQANAAPNAASHGRETEIESMPWGDQGGGGWQGGGRGPWGQGPRGAGPQPPDLEELLRRGQERFRRMLPGGGLGGRGAILAALVALSVWSFSGFYRVAPDEQGVELRFGRWTRTTQPGLNYHLPWPIETAVTPKVTRINREEIGFRSAPEGTVLTRQRAQPDVAEESLMLTGDENIVDIDFEVQWLIKDAGNFLFNIENPPLTIKAVAESAMREVIGKNQIQRILTEGRQPIERATQQLMQTVLDHYKAGVLITLVNLQKVDPPGAVIDAFRDVQSAQADRERAQNEAEAYRNDVIPRARGESQRVVQQAEAYKQEVIAHAQGDAARFTSVYKEFRQAKEVTAKRMYLETMEKLLHGMNKIIIDSPTGGQGVVPYLPLPELQRRRPPEPAPVKRP